MKVANSSGREYYLQRSKDNQIANWCSKVEPARIELDGTPVEAYGKPDKSDWIYLRYEGTAYCLWAKDHREFDFLNETSLRITDRGRPRKSRSRSVNAHDTVRTTHSPAVKMANKDRELVREDLETVLVHLPQLREQVAARASDPDTGEGMYSEEFSSAVRRAVKAFFDRHFMRPFNYQPWVDEARRLTEDRDALAAADLDTLRKLLVVHWRQDYWDYDNRHWEFVAANGHLVALLERLAEIADEMEPASASSLDSNPQTTRFRTLPLYLGT